MKERERERRVKSRSKEGKKGIYQVEEWTQLLLLTCHVTLSVP